MPRNNFSNDICEGAPLQRENAADARTDYSRKQGLVYSGDTKENCRIYMSIFCSFAFRPEATEKGSKRRDHNRQLHNQASLWNKKTLRATVIHSSVFRSTFFKYYTEIRSHQRMENSKAHLARILSKRRSRRYYMIKILKRFRTFFMMKRVSRDEWKLDRALRDCISKKYPIFIIFQDQLWV